MIGQNVAEGGFAGGNDLAGLLVKRVYSTYTYISNAILHVAFS